MPPKKVAPTASASKLPTTTQPGLSESQVAAPKPVKPAPAPAPEKAPKPAPVAEAPKEQPAKKPATTKVEPEPTESSKDTKQEVKPEEVKPVEEPEDPNKPSRCKRIISVLHKVFVIGTGLVMAGIGGIGYVQLFQGSTWEYAKSSYNVLVSRFLTNFWYVLFGLILWSGIFTIPLFTKYFEFTKNLMGLSIYCIL